MINMTSWSCKKIQSFSIIIRDKCFKTHSDGYYCVSRTRTVTRHWYINVFQSAFKSTNSGNGSES